ncbi:MAG TPA: pyridoxamine 5'-phosphate oxidase [Chitinophagales bacterium]|nr:pyridoxamine 5'-phosphate oxidase [Chitinophagales bacterium]HMU70784.1 pyridoxamine 5'-phosphate oxidase [Chitinophagales bacterium]HMZ88906.1 pyridoxamine 5'-phosphate oxidase [Chitinophagales bacterium]HNA56778.1 pyridoxamine 5'-phosphate oxidase [Chitinophagales bacterium]HNE46802.1 pyridoxamine 5'-phosphate oxidase [Chitinophagales bacterium]
MEQNEGKLHDMRTDYTTGVFDEQNAYPQPMQQFGLWFEEAIKAGISEANALVLSTVSNEGKPSSRVVLLKEYVSAGFIFFTNYNSRKGKELAANPYACMNFWWGAMERQVRINGRMEKIPATESDAYFYSRPVGSQAGAMISPQSEVIEGREWLEQQFIAQQLKGELKRPEHWGGYILIPEEFEFWQGRSNRLHDRLQYLKHSDGSWKIHRLAP